MPSPAFLADVGMGFTGLALGAMLAPRRRRPADDGRWRRPTAGRTSPPKAKSVIWLFMVGGASHMESFDPKPALNKYAGKTIAETPYKDVARIAVPEAEPARVRRPATHNGPADKLYPLQVGYSKRGQSGIEVSDWWPHVGDCADDLAVVRSMWTTDNDHGAQLQFHTGRHVLEGHVPDDRLVGPLRPRARSTTTCRSSSCSARRSPTAAAASDGHGGNYLGPEHAGVRLAVDPKNPLPFAHARARTLLARSRQAEFDLLGQLNRLAGSRVPRRPGDCGPASSRTSWPSACRRPCPRSSISTSETERDAEAVRPRPTRPRSRSASSAWPRGGWSSAACASCRSSTAERRRRRLGRARRPEGQPQHALRAGRSADRRRCSRT